MDMTLIYAVIIVVLIGCSAFFSMSETAFTSANQIRLKKMANDGDVRAEKTLKIINNYDRFLTTILIGNNLVNIGATSLATLVFSILLGSETGALASTVIMTLAVLTFGEITPKSIAKRQPEKVCMKICSIINFIQIVLTPLSWLFTKLTAFINRNGDEENVLTEDELEVMIDEIGNDGVIEKSECDLIKSALRFDDIQVSEVYVPRMDIIGVDVNDPVENLGQIITSSGFSRIPVYDGSIDNIIGVAYAKEFFTNSLLGVKFSIRDITKPIKYVPETMSIATILNDFQKSKVHMAVVLDSYGGTMGIITLEDLLEELVGDIWDESDEVLQDVVNIDDGRYNVKGVANLFDAAATMEMDIDPEGYEDYSVTGFITYKLGRAPLRGDVVETGDVTIRVLSVKGRRVMEAEFKKNPAPVEGE
ncbi:MAG: HlyC/CorC family transporter [Candidatus Methanomethylophilaceae archaeon]|nr:HlyC/CorC family transporter [Candidatus Methanomethylophilaceae archaeon]